jgi:hypothetical protein
VDPTNFYHLGQVRQQEIVERAALDQQEPRTKPAASRLGHVLLSLGARLLTRTGCETITTENGYTVTVRSAHCA